MTLALALRLARAIMVPVTAAAPPMSHFMSSMPSAGLIEMPPVSKQTPLPTKARGWAPASPPFHFMIASWLSRRLPWPTPNRVRMPSFSISASPRISTSRPRLSSAFTRLANSAGYRTLAGSDTRSRAKITPSATADSGSSAASAPRRSVVTTRMVVIDGILSAFCVVRYLSKR